MLTVVTGGDVYDPQPRGQQDVLVAGSSIDAIGGFNVAALERSGLEVARIDASGCYVFPGFVDPHQHLIGGGGEQGFSSQTPEIRLAELISAGATTVVGCLGVETTTKTMAALLAKAKALNAEGISASIYSGGYNVPPTTLTGAIKTDMMFVHEVIGAGEIAISDRRSSEPSIEELARLVSDTYVAGMLTNRAGVTHFHVGEGRQRLSKLRALLDDYDIDPAVLYPTHVQRNEDLIREAMELAARGVTVDLDVSARDLTKWLPFYFDNGGDETRITLSSDASLSTPRALFEEIRACICTLRLPIERVLPLATTNTARVLKLASKGRIARGADADLLLVEKTSFEIRSVMARGRLLYGDGAVCVREPWLKDSDRRFAVDGEKAAP
ncbi:MAG TPA: amidohydrolase family protein [Vicinamibacterales bacterium]|nr:amidohydrolase family protein [Vicinamibacterales bacterium]